MQNQDAWTILEDYLFVIVSEATTGSGVLAVQPNPDGSSGIKHVARIVPPVTKLFPNIGLMCTTQPEDITGAAIHDLKVNFVLAVSVRQPYDPSIADLGETALQNLRAYQNDGAGNGLSPLLRTNVTLGGLCQWSQITSMERHVLESDAEMSDMIATALYTFEARTTVKLMGIS
jgi:hypothetical protein